MNREKIHFTFRDGYISGYEPSHLSRDRGDWLAEDGEGVWHVWLQEKLERSPTEVKARPVTKRGEPHGWIWRLEVDSTHIHFPVKRIGGQRPSLPMKGTREVRPVKFYLVAYPNIGFGSTCYPRAEYSFSREMIIERMVSGLADS